jgi:serine/threonine protein kinase/WD40 repeat protein
MVEEALFAAALERTFAADRRAFLEEACAGDVALRDRLERLLAAHHRASGILDQPAGLGLPRLVEVTAGRRPRHSQSQRPRPRGAPPVEGAGTQVAGRYKLLAEIGEGGMGTVWRAEQTRPVRRTVALKIIKSGMDTRRVVARFEAERQVLAMMDHPNIARVLDAGTTRGGRPFFVMELVEGVPVTEYCDHHNLTLRARLELFILVCQAVQHAHQKGIIHRDLKPSNVLVARYDDQPVPKVIDFGVAKAAGQKLAEGTTFTQYGQLVGTLEYMSPEQAALNAPDTDTRSDIYALGVLLYELLTGSTPFERERLRAAAIHEILRIIREEEPQTPSKRLATTEQSPEIAAHHRTEPGRLASLVKGDLDWIVMKALEKDPARRYQTANGLAMELQRYLDDQPVQACPPSLRYRLGKFVRRNKGPVLAATATVLALVGGIIGTTWGMIRATDAQAVAVHAAEQKAAALAAVRQSERDATDQLYVALCNRARAGRYSRQMGQRLGSLNALSRAARIHPGEPLRDEAIAAMALADVRRVSIRHAALPGTGTVAVAYNSRYQSYARAETGGVISIRTIPDDQEVRRINSGPILDKYLFFSPDDRFLLGLAEGFTLRLWRVADGQPALRDRDELRGCRAHGFSPDGRTLAVGQQDWVLFFDLATGQETHRWRLPAIPRALAFHPDNRKLAVGYFDSSFVSVYDAASGTLLTNLPVDTMRSHVIAWHPHGERLAVAGSDPRIQIWNVAARRKVATLEGHVQLVTDLTFHPEGGLLASHSWDGLLRLWDPATGRPLLQLPLAVADRPRFSDDGRWLAAAPHGDHAELLEVIPNREYRTLVSSRGIGARGNYGDLSLDGRVLAVGMDEGTCLFDLPSGRELAALPAGTPFTYFDGKRTGQGDPGTHRGGRGHNALLTCGPDGLLRWPISSDDPEGRHRILGPPTQLSPLRRAWFARSPDGHALGAATQEGGANQVLDLETGRVLKELGRHPLGEVRALSGDGRWAASSGWHSDRVRLWNADTGQMVREWVVGKQTFVFFTPDSRTLIISRGDEYSFWDVTTQTLIHRLPRELPLYPGYVAFSPDGRLMALEMAPAVIHLKEVATGRTVARLEDPHADRATWQGFTPDGTQLVVVASYASAIHIWDLREIRTRLKDMNLDWDWPAFPPPATASGSPAAPPATIEVRPYGWPALGLTRERRAQQDIEHGRRQVEAEPDSASACNALAWTYLTAPEALRDRSAALSLAETAVQRDPANSDFRNTLGLAYYRVARYREAVEVLRPNLQRQADTSLALDLFFLAMCHHCLGEPARARDYYDWAVRWARTQGSLNQGAVEELTTLRAEAEVVLGIDRKID